MGVVGLEPTQLIATVLQTAMTLQLHRTPLCTFLWVERDSNPRTLMRAVLQTASFNHLHIYPIYFNKKTQSVFVRLGLLFYNVFTPLLYTHNASDRWYSIPRLISAYRFYCYCYVSNCCHFFYFLILFVLFSNSSTKVR